MAIDPIWAGVIGTAVGAVAGSATSLLAPLINWRTESRKLDKQRDHQKELSESQHKMELERIEATADIGDREYKRGLVVTWRDGISAAAKEHQIEVDQAEAARQVGIQSAAPTPKNVLTLKWFETLRPHLDLEHTAHFEVAYLHTFLFDAGTTRALSDEVSRIEREWKLV